MDASYRFLAQLLRKLDADKLPQHVQREPPVLKYLFERSIQAVSVPRTDWDRHTSVLRLHSGRLAADTSDMNATKACSVTQSVMSGDMPTFPGTTLPRPLRRKPSSHSSLLTSPAPKAHVYSPLA